MMDAQFWKATGITFVINLAYAMVALVIGVVAVRWIDRHIYTEIDFMEEIKRGNIAAAIYGAVLLLLVGVILAAALVAAAAAAGAQPAAPTREPASKAAAILTWSSELRERYIAALDSFFLTRTVKAGSHVHGLERGLSGRLQEHRAVSRLGWNL